MSVEIRLFGPLCHRAGEGIRSGTAVYLSAVEAATVGQVLDHLGIDLSEVGNLFLNGRLLYGGNPTTKNDVYEGDTPANGDIKVDFPKGVKTGDIFISIGLQ